jgi:hypothetical protein
VIAAAGTADGPVAAECEAVLRVYGFSPVRLDDVGVAGIHRLLAHTDTLAAADAVVVVAGMEGALASVVGGLTAAPVIAVPTSAGYGAAFGGVTALLAMLSSCARAWPSSASTTASARPAPSRASATSGPVGPEGADGWRWPGSTASPASPGRRSAPCWTRARTSTRSGT